MHPSVSAPGAASSPRQRERHRCLVADEFGLAENVVQRMRKRKYPNPGGENQQAERDTAQHDRERESRRRTHLADLAHRLAHLAVAGPEAPRKATPSRLDKASRFLSMVHNIVSG